MGGDANNHCEAVSRGFVEELRRFHLLAGRPTLNELEALSKQRPGMRVLSRSTTHDILKGKRFRIPELAWVISFVTACRIHAERTASSVSQLADVTDWHTAVVHRQSSCAETAPWPVSTGTDGGPSPRRRRPGNGLLRDETEEASRAALLALTKHAQVLGGWQAYGDVVPDWFEPYLSLEPAAGRIRTYETEFVPGLLQTEDYARTTIRLGNPEASAAEVERRVELRMLRQQILHRPDAPILWAVIEERVLCHPLVAPAIMRAQIKHLIMISQQHNVAIQVMRAAPGGHATAGGPITILRFPEREIPEVGYLEQVTHGLYPDNQQDLDHYRQVLDRLGLEATNGAATVRILYRILADT